MLRPLYTQDQCITVAPARRSGKLLHTARVGTQGSWTTWLTSDRSAMRVNIAVFIIILRWDLHGDQIMSTRMSTLGTILARQDPTLNASTGTLWTLDTRHLFKQHISVL